MVGVSGIVTGPIESAVIVPDGEDILFSDCNGFLFLTKNFSHKGQEILSWITINSDNFVALLRRKLFHDGLNNAVRILVELLEIMAEISHNMGTVENSFQKLILSSHIVDIALFRRTEIVVNTASNELIFKPMNGPSDMGGKSTVVLSICGLGFPNKLSLVLEQDMLIRPFHKVPFNTQMSKNSQRGL